MTNIEEERKFERVEKGLSKEWALLSGHELAFAEFLEAEREVKEVWVKYLNRHLKEEREAMDAWNKQMDAELDHDSKIAGKEQQAAKNEECQKREFTVICAGCSKRCEATLKGGSLLLKKIRILLHDMNAQIKLEKYKERRL